MGRIALTKALSDVNVTMVKCYDGVEIVASGNTVNKRVVVPSWDLADEWIRDFEQLTINNEIDNK